MNIYVGNLSYSTPEESVRELFEQHGQVESVKLIKDRFTGNSKGFAFVTMSDADAQKAIEAVNGQEFEGKNLRVSVANETEGGSRPARPSYGNRDGGSRGGFGGDRGGYGDRNGGGDRGGYRR